MKYDVLTSFCVYSMYIKNISRSGGKYLSPFRDEVIPSFSIDGVSGRWYDFGLGIGGDVVTFIQAVHKCSFTQACGIIDRDLDGYDKQEKVYKCGSMDTSNIRNKRTYKLNQTQLEGYLNNLLKGGSVYDDLVNRGIRLATVIKYKLGLSYYKGKSWLLIPYDYNNNPVCSYKRIFRGDKGKEVMTSGKGVIYPLEVIYDNDELVLCEGELDALALNGYGIPAVTGTVGCGTFKKEWIDLFKGKRVRIMYDFDEPGYKGSNMVNDLLSNVCNTQVYTWDRIVESPYKGFDVCDYFKHKGNPRILKERLEL